MSNENQVIDEHGCGADVAAYALGALDPEEVDAFRRHLESCAVCRDELAAFEGVVDLLPMSAPQQPIPRGLRRRVMRAVESEPGREGDRVRGPRRAGARTRAPRRRMRLGEWLVPRPALGLGAALVLAVCVFAGAQLISSSGSSARVVAAQVVGQGTAQLRITGTHGELIVHRFSPPPAGHIYQVWLTRPGRPPSPTSALFSVTTNGDADVEVPGSLHGITRVMVTPEPAGGSRAPIHPPVIEARLA